MFPKVHPILASMLVCIPVCLGAARIAAAPSNSPEALYTVLSNVVMHVLAIVNIMAIPIVDVVQMCVSPPLRVVSLLTSPIECTA